VDSTAADSAVAHGAVVAPGVVEAEAAASVDLAAADSVAAAVAENGNSPAMRKLLILFFLLVLSGTVWCRVSRPDTGLRLFEPAKKKFFDTTVAERGWVARAAYNRQETTNWGEFGFGRMARLQHYNAFAKGTTAAAASFTFGADIGYDSSFIVAPKLSMEFSSLIFGGRVSYGYYMQDGNSSGVIGLEGGLNIVSVFFVYAGYNFVKGNSDTPVVTEGSKLSVGFNYPIGMRRVPPPKRPTHL
jgi:hypothetical protein